MEILKNKYENFKNAYNKLEEGYEILENCAPIYQDHPNFVYALKSGVIRYFDIANVLAYKFLSKYLQEYKNIDLISHKTIIEYCNVNNILPSETIENLNKLLKTSENSNLIYERDMHEQVYLEIIQYRKVFKQILEILKLENS